VHSDDATAVPSPFTHCTVRLIAPTPQLTLQGENAVVTKANVLPAHRPLKQGTVAGGLTVRRNSTQARSATSTFKPRFRHVTVLRCSPTPLHTTTVQREQLRDSRNSDSNSNSSSDSNSDNDNDGISNVNDNNTNHEAEQSPVLTTFHVYDHCMDAEGETVVDTDREGETVGEDEGVTTNSNTLGCTVAVALVLPLAVTVTVTVTVLDSVNSDKSFGTLVSLTSSSMVELTVEIL
jgi:hypothetical protein